MKKLTIITINFNNKEGLQRTIDSIVNQTFTDYEWIVVDGGSSDGSKDLIEQYQEHFAWWCSEPDKGVYNAMNKGIVHAKGEYINFMNSGDIFATPTILEEIFNQTHTADILYGLMAENTIDGNIRGQLMLKPYIKWWDFFNDNIGHQSEFMKRKLFDYKKYNESFKIAADWEWNAYMFAKKRVTSERIPQVLSVVETGGISYDDEKLSKEIDVIRERYYFILTSQDIAELHSFSKVMYFKVSSSIYKILVTLTRRICRYFEIFI